MQIIKTSYNDFDHYSEVISDWELDLKLLSKNKFHASLNRFSNESFSLFRTQLHGKVDQRGLTPEGCVTIGIPANYDSNYFWLNKRVGGKDMLIFPKDRTLDGVTYSDFDNYVISIDKTILFQTIEDLGFKNCKEIFDGGEKTLFLSKEFSYYFHQLASNFLSANITTPIIHKILIINQLRQRSILTFL